MTNSYQSHILAYTTAACRTIRYRMQIRLPLPAPDNAPTDEVGVCVH